MNICIPIEMDNGLISPTCPHFGSAPAYMIVDTDTGACRAVVNANLHQGSSMCMPLQSLQAERIDAMVVGGIGMGALNKLNAANISVYISRHATVDDAVTAFKAKSLELMQPGMACAHHGHDHS